MQSWCNVKPFNVCIYFKTYCWWPCYDLVDPVVGRLPLLWIATSLSYVNFLLMSMFLSLLHTQTCTQSHSLMHTHTHTHTHTLTFLMKGLLFRAFPQIFWVEPAMQSWCNGNFMFVLILGPIAGGLLWPCGACTCTSTLDSNITKLY